ncbi:MAG: helix-turn-helix domain-containing protein [Saezia sp.]
MTDSTFAQEWFTADELCGIGGLPQHRSSFSTKATKEKWLKRQRSGKRGAAFEYHISSLPEMAQRMLRDQATKRGATDVPPMLWTVQDHSMAPTLRQGEQVAFVYPAQVNSGGLFLVKIDKSTALRRLQWLMCRQEYAVSCDNPRYPTTYHPKDDILILAKVIGILSPLR